MSVYVSLVDELARRIESAPISSQVVLFWACSNALIDEFYRWTEVFNGEREPILRAALDIAFRFAVSGEVPADAAKLLTDMETWTPPGEAPDHVSSTAAQDCWICADICIRLLVDKSYEPGRAIHYALEPLMLNVTEEMYGYSDMGTGEGSQAEVSAVLANSRMQAAVQFVRWAVDVLNRERQLSEVTLSMVLSRSSALAP